MTELLNSPFFNNLKAGKLPEVEVTVSDKSLISIAGTLVLAGIIVLMAKKLLDTI